LLDVPHFPSSHFETDTSSAFSQLSWPPCGGSRFELERTLVCRPIFNVDHDGITIRIPKAAFSPKLWARSSVKHALRWRNRILTALWPVPGPIVIFIMIAFTVFVMQQPLESW
jgi:hypothetical protein